MTKKREKKGKYIGAAGALLIHAGVVLFLLLAGFSLPQQEEESGIPVLLGAVAEAEGKFEQSLVKVNIETAANPADPTEQELLTQEEEETIAIPKETKQLTEETKKPSKEEMEKEKERKAEETARLRIANAFGKGAQMEHQGTSEGKGAQGSTTGNIQETSAGTTGGYGTFSLGGRSIGEGGLPRPTYTVQEEGKVVVNITVNPAGQVIATSINRQTDTVNPTLRKAAQEAAAKARFNTISGPDNQTGTITYFFNLKME